MVEYGSVIESLKNILGNEHVITEEKTRDYYSTDLSWKPREIAEVVIQPDSTAQLSEAVRVASGAGMAVVARGGGMSYTSGYTPEQAGTMLVDMRRMNRILDINNEDMYVRVECGCTWKALFDALREKGVRTPYFGPLSGKYATVGGALSQNSQFLGSGVYNTAADSALGLKLVLGDGSVIQTGSAIHVNGTDFLRHYGPDLTGIFTTDTGAFGLKTEATLRLIELPPVTVYMSFGFETLTDMLNAQTRLARKRLISECYGFDPYYNKSFEKMGFTFKEGIAVLKKIAGKGGVAKGLISAFNVAKAGKSFLRDVNYSLHMAIDAFADPVAESALQICRGICLEENGYEIENSIPTAFRAEPFSGVRTLLLGAEGEIWLPVHGMVPLSKAHQLAQATEKFLADNEALMKKHGIKTSYLTCFSGSDFVIEPSFYWRDELGPFRLSLIEPEFQKKWKEIPANLEVRKIALQLRDDLRQVYFDQGACHMQIGKYYQFQESIGNEPYRKLLSGIKDVVDKQRIVNPGSLGLR
jgi:D-lactate dehydrogenase (cytochrome)